MREFLTTPQFRKAFARLSDADQRAAKKALKVFKQDPFDKRLGTHMIKKLSARWGTPVYAVEILGNLRAAFYVDGGKVVSIDIGTHDIYK